MTADKSKFDCGYDLKNSYLKKVLEKLNKKHNIGFHPSYYAYHDSLLWKKEWQKLEGFSKEVTLNLKKIGRQHYLR